MKANRNIPLVALAFLCGCAQGPFVVGSKPFTESEVLAEMIALLAEDQGARVERRFHLRSEACFTALVNGDLDAYPEYTGTGLVNILKEPSTTDPEAAYARVKERFRRRWGLRWLPRFGFNDSWVLAMRRAQAEELGIRKLSDLKGRTKSLRCGFEFVFGERPDGYAGLKERLGTDFCSAIFNMDPDLMYSSLDEGQVDIISAYGTDSRIKSLGLFPLEDDLGFFPPYEGAPLLGPNALGKVPGLEAKLNALAGAIDTETMTALNAQVDADRRGAGEVARKFLKIKGLLD